MVLLACSACTAATAPATSPTASVPSVPAFPAVRGRTLSSSASDGEWHRVVRVADADAAYAAARRLLVEGGFTLTKDRQGRGGGDGQACTTALCVSFAATDIPGTGPTVAYDVFHSTGVVG